MFICGKGADIFGSWMRTLEAFELKDDAWSLLTALKNDDPISAERIADGRSYKFSAENVVAYIKASSA